MKAGTSRRRKTAGDAATTSVAATSVAATSVAATSVTEEPAPVRTRASRKKLFPVVAVITAEGSIQGSLSPEKKKPLIAHLPFSSTEVMFHDGPVSYDPRPPGQPEPFDDMLENYDVVNETAPAEQSNGFVKDETAVEESETTLPPPIPTQDPLPVFTKADLNLYSRERGEVEVPETTDIACFWCAHQFDGRPVFIPYDEKGGVWHVYGNFCCPECALAYCLDEKEDSHIRWEKVSLLHRLYAPVVGGRIYPAPARILLKHFGGMLSIEDYRTSCRKRSVRVDVHYPPMVSLLATMDTKPIDFYETTIHKTFVPLNTERVKKVEEGLRLKRTKPLKDRDSTLDACMNLQIKRS